VIEAMTCGLPTFATAYGGPAEIIVNGVSGYHIDPYQNEKASALLVEFFEKCLEDPSHWNKISQGGLQRIEEKYTCTASSSVYMIHMCFLFYQH
jgi:sucrose synthase